MAATWCRKVGWGCAVLGLWVVAGVRPSARADIFIERPGTKTVPVTITLDWGPVADHVSRPHVVAPGETLRALAARYLGKAEAWPRIAEANASRVRPPDGIQAGATLWIPGRTPTHEAFWVKPRLRYGGGWAVVARAQPAPLTWAHGERGVLMFLPSAEAAPVIAALEDKREMSWETTPPAARLLALGQDATVKEEDPVVRLEARYVLLGLEGDEVRVEHTVLRLDARGEVLPPWPDVAVKPAPASAGPPGILLASDLPVEEPLAEKIAARWPAWLGVLVAVVGLLVVVAVARRRRGTTGTPAEDDAA